jgi:hypothetical protein
VVFCCDSGGPGHGHHFVGIGHAVPVGQPSNMLEAFGYGFPCEQIYAAYEAARWSRFEHGESGYP